MFAIVYGPAKAPEGKTDAEYEAAEAVRREKVVADEVSSEFACIYAQRCTLARLARTLFLLRHRRAL